MKIQFKQMISKMKVIGVFVVILLKARFGYFGPNGRIQDMNVVDALSQNIMSDPLGTVQSYFNHAEPFMMKSSLRYHLLANGRAFNLTLIDVRLILSETQEHFKYVFDLHSQNTSPLMKTSLVVLMNSFLTAIHKLNNFVSNSNSSVNNALVNSGPTTEAAMLKAVSAIAKLQACAVKNNLTSDVNFVGELHLCIASEITDLTLEFNKFMSHLNLFKAHFPASLLELTDCIVTNQNMTEIRPVLKMSKCMGDIESKWFDAFYKILNGGNEHMIKLVTKVVRMSTRFNECRVNNVNNFKVFLILNNVSCN